MVNKRLFAMEAQKRGMTEDALREQLKTQTGEVTDADVDAFYEQNRSRIQQPKEQIIPQIRPTSTQQKLQKAEADFFAEAEKNFAVETLLEPMRVEVAATGSARGPATAPVTIVEFSDFQCPYCSARAADARAGGRRSTATRCAWSFATIPLSIHADAQKAAEASIAPPTRASSGRCTTSCSRSSRSSRSRTSRRRRPASGSTPRKFGECLDSDRHAEAVQTDMRDGTAAGVNGTPAFFVNGRFLSGAVPFETMAELIDDEMQARRQRRLIRRPAAAKRRGDGRCRRSSSRVAAGRASGRRPAAGVPSSCCLCSATARCCG